MPIYGTSWQRSQIWKAEALFLVFSTFPSNSLSFSQNSMGFSLLAPHPTPSSCPAASGELIFVQSQFRGAQPLFKKYPPKLQQKIIFFNTKLLFFFIPHGPTTRKYWFPKLAAKMVKLHVVHTILCNFNPSGFVFYCWHKIQPLFCIASRPTFYFQVNQGLLWL